MINSKLKGMGVALITPFKDDESIDFDALSRIVEYQIKNGTDYLVVCGTTAETPTLTEKEKEEVKNFVVSVNRGRLPIVLGVGGNNTKAIVEKVQTTDFTGIDAILSVTPYYNKPSQEGLYQHYRILTILFSSCYILSTVSIPRRLRPFLRVCPTARVNSRRSSFPAILCF